jgi:hypothetical protein
MLESEYDTSTRSTTRECNWRATEKSMIEGARKGARRWTRLQYIDEHASPPPTATVFSGNFFFAADSGQIQGLNLCEGGKIVTVFCGLR